MLVGIIDSSEFQAKKIRYILNALGSFDYIEAPSAEDFLRKSGNQNLDLLIMELDIPNTNDAFQLLATLKMNPLTANLNIIVITRQDDIELRDILLKFSIRDFIVKPYKASRLENSIKILFPSEPHFEYSTEGIDFLTMTFDIYIDRELKIANRLSHPLSIIVFTPSQGLYNPSPRLSTLDAGNLELKSKLITDTIKKHLRLTDTIFRNENGDILIVLPFTDSKGTSAVASKVQIKIDEMVHSNTALEGYYLIHSWVTYPEDGCNFSDLIKSCSKKLSAREMVDRTAGFSQDTREYADRKYKQLRSWDLNF